MNDTNNVSDTIAGKVVERGDSDDISPDRATVLAVADGRPIATSAEMKYDACTVLLHRLKGAEGQSNGNTVTPQT